MKLLELFNSKVDFKVKNQTATHFTTTAQINGRTINTIFTKEDGMGDDLWEVSFVEIVKGKATYALTGNGGALEVLTHVFFDAMRMFAEIYHPATIYFSAEKEKTNRASIYLRILKKLKLKGYKIDHRVQHGMPHDDFYLVRED